MKKRISIISILLMFVLVGLLLVGGCSSSSELPPDAPVPPTTPEPIVPGMEPEESGPIMPVSEWPEYLDLSIGIDSIQSQEHFDAVMNGAIGDDFTVTLGSNPTTGFQWLEVAEIGDETILQQTDHIFMGPGIDKPPGTAGEEVWIFKALKKGTTTVDLEYSRPWVEEDADYRTVSITINIR